MTASMKIEAMAPETWSSAPHLPRERRSPSRAVNVTARATLGETGVGSLRADSSPVRSSRSFRSVPSEPV